MSTLGINLNKGTPLSSQTKKTDQAPRFEIWFEVQPQQQGGGVPTMMYAVCPNKLRTRFTLL